MHLKETRQGYADALIELARQMPELVVLDADVSKATKTCDFAKVFPDRFFNCGAQEQNMLSVAAGLALEGFIPFATTFGVFATGTGCMHHRLWLADASPIGEAPMGTRGGACAPRNV